MDSNYSNLDLSASKTQPLYDHIDSNFSHGNIQILKGRHNVSNSTVVAYPPHDTNFAGFNPSQNNSTVPQNFSNIQNVNYSQLIHNQNYINNNENNNLVSVNYSLPNMPHQFDYNQENVYNQQPSIPSYVNGQFRIQSNPNRVQAVPSQQQSSSAHIQAHQSIQDAPLSINNEQINNKQLLAHPNQFNLNPQVQIKNNFQPQIKNTVIPRSNFADINFQHLPNHNTVQQPLAIQHQLNKSSGAKLIVNSNISNEFGAIKQPYCSSKLGILLIL